MRRLGILIGIAAFSLLGAAQQQPIPEGIIVQPNQTPLALQLGLDKVSYSPGDTLRLTVTLNQDAYVYIYNITPDRRVNLLFPNAYQPENLLRAGTHTIPDKRYSLVISPPTGFECLQVLALTAPLPLEQLIPGGAPQSPFPLLSHQPQEFKAFMQNLIIGAVSTTGWAAAWSCFQIAPPFRPLGRTARLRIVSDPDDADVFINGAYAGRTPLGVELAPGRYRVVVTKTNYESWSQTLELKGDSEITLEAVLKPFVMPPTSPVPPTPPPVPPGPPPSVLFKPRVLLGLNGGLNAAQIPSVGFDFSFALGTNFVGLGASFSMTGEDVPEYENVGSPIDIGPAAVYREGPETEFYGKLSLALVGGLGVDVAGGIAIQKEAHIALPLAPSAFSALDVVVKPNGYQTEKIYLTGLIGLRLRSENLLLSAGMHSRRGWVIGVGAVF